MLFQPAARYPADPRALFMLVLSVFSGGMAIAFRAAPQSINAVLPVWGVVVWSILLVAGSVLTLVGMLFQSLNGIIAEQIGSVAVGATTVFYSVIAFNEVGRDAVQPVGIVLAWGISCFLRWIQLQILINRAYRSKLIAEVKSAQ